MPYAYSGPMSDAQKAGALPPHPHPTLSVSQSSSIFSSPFATNPQPLISSNYPSSMGNPFPLVEQSVNLNDSWESDGEFYDDEDIEDQSIFTSNSGKPQPNSTYNMTPGIFGANQGTNILNSNSTNFGYFQNKSLNSNIFNNSLNKSQTQSIPSIFNNSVSNTVNPQETAQSLFKYPPEKYNPNYHFNNLSNQSSSILSQNCPFMFNKNDSSNVSPLFSNQTLTKNSQPKELNSKPISVPQSNQSSMAHKLSEQKPIIKPKFNDKNSHQKVLHNSSLKSFKKFLKISKNQNTYQQQVKQIFKLVKLRGNLEQSSQSKKSCAKSFSSHSNSSDCSKQQQDNLSSSHLSEDNQTKQELLIDLNQKPSSEETVFIIPSQPLEPKIVDQLKDTIKPQNNHIIGQEKEEKQTEEVKQLKQKVKNPIIGQKEEENENEEAKKLRRRVKELEELNNNYLKIIGDLSETVKNISIGLIQKN